MNTADRSIAPLDTALRRRFQFKELMPDYDALDKATSGYKIPANESSKNITLGAFLKTLNYRIEFLYDREHTIGHEYFRNVKNNDDLIAVMKNQILPLLQEYFYDDWEKIAQVLGKSVSKAAVNKENGPYLLIQEEWNTQELFGESEESMESRVKYAFSINPSIEAIKAIMPKEKIANG